MKLRAFTNPDGSLRIVYPNPRLRLAGETDEAFIARIGAATVERDPTPAGLSFTDVDEADVPQDRSQRDKWRLNGKAVRVDNSLPDRPHPKQAMLDRINQANDVAALKQVLADIVRS